MNQEPTDLDCEVELQYNYIVYDLRSSQNI